MPLIVSFEEFPFWELPGVSTSKRCASWEPLFALREVPANNS